MSTDNIIENALAQNLIVETENNAIYSTIETPEKHHQTFAYHNSAKKRNPVWLVWFVHSSCSLFLTFIILLLYVYLYRNEFTFLEVEAGPDAKKKVMCNHCHKVYGAHSTTNLNNHLSICQSYNLTLQLENRPFTKFKKLRADGDNSIDDNNNGHTLIGHTSTTTSYTPILTSSTHTTSAASNITTSNITKKKPTLIEMKRKHEDIISLYINITDETMNSTHFSELFTHDGVFHIGNKAAIG